MKVIDITGVTEKIHNFDDACEGIYIMKHGAAAGDFTNETLKVSVRKDNAEPFVVVDEELLLDFRNFSSQGEGGNIIKDATINAGENTSVVYIKFTKGGSFPLENDEDFKLELTGLTAGVTYSVYAKQTPGYSRVLLKYEEKELSADNKKKTFLINNEKGVNHEFVAVDVTNMSLLKMKRLDGQYLEIDKDEFTPRMADMNDLVQVDYSKDPTLEYQTTYFQNGYFIHSTDAFQEIRVEATGATSIYLVSSRVMPVKIRLV